MSCAGVTACQTGVSDRDYDSKFGQLSRDAVRHS